MVAKDIKTKVKLEGEAEFNRQMTAMNNGLKTTRSDMAALSAEFEDNAKTTEALSAKQKLLQSSYDQQKAKVDALNAQYEKAKAVLGENESATQKYRQQLNQARADLAKAKSALDENSDALNKSKSSLRNAASGYVDLINKLADAKDKLDEFVEKHKKAGELIKIVATPVTALATGAEKSAAAVGKTIVSITKLGAAAVTTAGAIGVAALTAMVSFAKESAEAAKAAQEAGETLTESQQQWLAYSNQLDALDASVASAKGALAGVLLPVLSDLSTEGAAFLNDFSRDMQAAAGDTGAQTKVLSDYIVKGAQLIKAKLPEYIATGKELFQGLAEGLGGENGDELFDMGIDLVMSLLDGIIEYAPDLAEAGIQLVQRLTESLIERGPELVTAAVGMVTQIVQGLAQAAPDLILMAGQLVVTLIQALISAAPDLLLAGMELIYGIVSGLIEGLGDIGEASGDIIDAIKQAFADSAGTFLDIGSQIVAKIKQGISDAWEGVKSWFKGLVNSLTASISVNVSGSRSTDGSHAGGLDYVPFDGYIAELHRGEMVLTSAEADWYRRGNALGRGTVQKVFNLTINTQSLSKSDLDMLVDYVNGKLGDDL